MKILQVGTLRLVTIVSAFGLLAGSLGYAAEAGTGRDDDIKLSGCLIRGEESAGYLPNASFMWAADRDKEKGGILVRRVNVEKVKMIGAGCE